MAKHLSLSIYIPSLEVSRRNRRTDSHRMKELLIIWRFVRPGTYTVETLLNMLDILLRVDTPHYQAEHVIAGHEEHVRVDPPTYVISRLNSSSLAEVSSDRIGRSFNPRPQSCYYSSPNYEKSVLISSPTHSSTPANSRPL